jgi:hypothetical protein
MAVHTTAAIGRSPDEELFERVDRLERELAALKTTTALQNRINETAP